MLKKILKLGIMGAAIGITFSIIMTIIMSFIMYGLGYSDGQFYYATPQFTQLIGSESVAALLVFLACSVYGFLVGAVSYVWKMERLGLTKQTLIHFIVMIFLLPLAIALNWIPCNVVSIFIFIGIFIGIYVIIWLVNYLVLKNNIKKMNHKLQQ